MDPVQVAEALARRFAQKYHQIFATNYAEAARFYRANSFLHFDGEKILGYERILTKFTNLEFRQWQHRIISVDAQPSSIPGSVLVFVNGDVICAQAGEQLAFTLLETFQLMPEEDGGLYILNHHSRFVKVGPNEEAVREGALSVADQ